MYKTPPGEEGGGGGGGGGGGSIASSRSINGNADIIGPIHISHLYGIFFFFIFSWPYHVLPMPKFKRSKSITRVKP